MFNDANYQLVLDSISDGVYLLDPKRRIVYWNKGAEHLTGFTAEEVVGRCCRDNILTHIDCTGKCLCTSSCIASQTLEDGQPRSAHLYLHHKDGYRVPVRVTVNPVRDESGVVVGVAEVFSDESATIASRASIEFLKRQAMNDPLTGLPNRRFLEAKLQSRLEEFNRFGWPVGIFLAEVDDLKEVAARGGRELCDRAMKMTGMALANALRSLDTLGRWGGEEFMGIVANVPVEELGTVGERARILVESSYLHLPDGLVRVTVSLGVASAEVGDTVETLLKKANACLYQSKSKGRNRVTVHRLG